MSSRDRIEEKPIDDLSKLDASGLRIGIVVSEWNREITGKLLRGCMETLTHAGLSQKDMKILHVPGSYELPSGATLLLNKGQLDTVICLGCVIKGETRHDEYINHAVAQGLIQLNLKYLKPVIFGLLTVENKKQAEDRTGGPYGNKGAEAAKTAIRMAKLYQNI